MGDQVALLPAYVAAGTAVLVLLADLLVPGRRAAVLGVAALGALATAAVSITIGAGDRAHRAFCLPGDGGCSLVADKTSAVVAALFGLLTLGVLALSAPLLANGDVPAGEYCFLLACSMTGGVVLGSARDFISLIVALETLTLPLYVLVGLRRGALTPAVARAAPAAVTFFVVSVVSTAVALLGAALLYAGTGALHFARLAAALDPPPDPRLRPLISAGVVLLLAGLGFKVAAVPLHAWAPATYDGAPLPVAAYLSTASKLGGVAALVLVTLGGFAPVLATAGPALAVLAVLSMTVGNLVALRQRRMVRLLAWSSIAQAGYILAPLGAFALHGGRAAGAVGPIVAATVAYTVFYVLIEFGAFTAVIAIRGETDGGDLADFRGAARRSPWPSVALVLALAGLAGLPPGLAGLFAKVAVVRALLGGHAVWLAIVVAVNAVVGLAYYVRVAAMLFAAPDPALEPTPEPAPGEAAAGPVGAAGLPVAVGAVASVDAQARRPVPWAVGVALVLATIAAIVVGVAPQLIMSAAGAVAP